MQALLEMSDLPEVDGEALPYLARAIGRSRDEHHWL
jgi:hypothetical protein